MKKVKQKIDKDLDLNSSTWALIFLAGH